MSELIPNISFTEFKKLKPEQLRRLKSCEVTYNGEYMFTFVNPQTDYIRLSVDSLAQIGNTVGDKETLEQILEESFAQV